MNKKPKSITQRYTFGEVNDFREHTKKLEGRIKELEEAIEFACAPDMWVEQDDGMYDYRYFKWYVDVLQEALDTRK